MRRTGKYYTTEVDETGKVVAVYALREEAQDKKTWPKVMENVRTTRTVMGEDSNLGSDQTARRPMVCA